MRDKKAERLVMIISLNGFDRQTKEEKKMITWSEDE